ncbi:MAG: hypothetical protein ACRDCG_01965 [Mycoplasmoidaceae bacterium]
MNKFKISKLLPIISICSLCSISLFSSLVSSSKKHESFVFHNLSEPSNKNFDLATNDLKNNDSMYIDNSSIPPILRAQKIFVNEEDFNNPNLYNNHSVISTSSSNTVYNSNYTFNFVPDPSKQHLKIIGTPIDPNINDYISLNTDLKILKSSENIDGLGKGSALWINNKLFVCSEDTNGKQALYEFTVEKTIPGIVGTRNVLVQKEKIIFDNVFGSSANYSISPISNSVDHSQSFILWPQGISNADFKNHQASVKEISFLNEKMNIKNIYLNLNYTPNQDQIISMNCIQTNRDRTFFFITRGSNAAGNLTGYQVFGDDRNPIVKKIAGLNDGGTDTTRYERPQLDKVKQYALVNSDIKPGGGEFNLYWVSQNANSVSNPAPESINKMTLKINENGIFESNRAYDSQSIPINVQSGSFQANLKIRQISYDNSDSSVMNFRFIDWRTGSLLDTINAPIFFGESHPFNYKALYDQFNNNSWRASGFIQSSSLDPEEAMTVSNGNQFYTYIKINFGTPKTSYVIMRPALLDTTAGTETFRNPTTLDTQKTRTIILPQGKKIDDIDYSSWDKSISPLPSPNSALRISVNNINNILDYQKIFNTPSAWDDTINISFVDDSNSDHYKIFSTITKYGLSNGIFTKGSSFSNDFILINNPLSFDRDLQFFNINKNLIKGKASVAATQLNLFSSLKTKNLTIGKTYQKTIQEKIIPPDQNIIGSIKDKSLFYVNKDYMDFAYDSLHVSSDDNNGILKGSIYFLNKSTKDLVVIDFDLSGFSSLIVVLVPSIVVPIVLIALALLITMIILKKKNKKDVVEVSRSGYKMAKKLTTNTEEEYKKSMTKHIELTTTNSNNSATAPTSKVPHVVGKPPVTAPTSKVPPVVGKPPVTAPTSKVPPVVGKPPVTAPTSKVPPVVGKPPVTAPTSKVPPVVGKPPIK